MRSRSALSLSSKSKAGIVQQFSIFRNIAGENANTRAHGIQQGQRQPFQVGGQHEKHGVGEQFVQRVSGDPVQNANSIALLRS